MKKNSIILLLFCISFGATAQNGINYKTLIKDTSGNVVSNQSITIEFDILRGAGFNLVYSESHNPTTDANGIVIVNIGEGSILSGDFTTIDWSLDTHYLNVEIDIGGGPVDFGRTEFKAVPYAIQADKALNVKGLEAIDEGNGIGWRLIGRDPTHYGNIGAGSTDLSNNGFPSTDMGATGSNAFASGVSTRATGDRSTAMGSNTQATGSEATALGNTSFASGSSSFAVGLGSTASGNYSSAFGFNTEASGTHAFAGGDGSDATGESSFAFGDSNDAIGDYSLAYGLNTIASGTYSFAGGNGTNASGESAFTFGNGNAASGNYSAAFGENTTASHPHSYAFGLNTSATQNYSFVSGNGSTASGQSSVAMGQINDATGFSAFAVGINTTASGAYSTSSGTSTTASGWGAFATNSGTIASGETSAAFGAGTQAESENSFALGRFNVGGGNGSLWVPTDPLFEIGIGTAGNDRLNAMTVLKNGNVGIGTITPNNKLQITNGTDVSASNALGYLVLGNGNGTNIGFDNNEIQARNNNAPAPLYLQNEGGVEGDLNNGTGFVVLGNENGANLLLDNNEIQARNNGSNAILHLNPHGNLVVLNSAVIVTSDGRLKKEINDLDYGLKAILELNPVSYYWKDKPNLYGKSIGLIAQHLQKVVHEAVYEIEKDGETLLHVDYSALIPVLIKAIQQQQDIIESQKKKNALQEKQLEDFMVRLEALEDNENN